MHETDCSKASEIEREVGGELSPCCKKYSCHGVDVCFEEVQLRDSWEEDVAWALLGIYEPCQVTPGVGGD